MATLNQIKVNTGTEDSPTYVLHDVHDKRLDDGASSLVTTCTHLLATNAALSSFNPITSANLASVLGDGYLAVSSNHELGNGDFNSFPNGLYFVAGNSFSNSPIDAVGDLRGFVRTESYANGSYKTQEFVSCNGLGNANGAHFSRALYNSVWTSWQRIDNYGTTSLSGLASALGADHLKIKYLGRNSGDGSVQDLVQTLCVDVKNRFTTGIVVYYGNWIYNISGYQAIVCKSPYGDTVEHTRVSGMIFRYSDGSLHHFTANCSSDGTWEYKIDL